MDDIELHTKRLTLRRLRPSDADRLADIADDVRIARNLTHLFPQGVHSFGYWLGVDYWGNGYATEAGRAYLDHIINTDGADRVRRVEASVFGWNPASGAILMKLGLAHEGTRPNRVLRFGEATDQLLYGMLVV